jgi:hypothetical protein
MQKIPKTAVIALFVFATVVAISMGALAFTQKEFASEVTYSNKVGLTIVGVMGLPVALFFFLTKIVIPSTNKSKEDDENVHPLAFIIYHFAMVVGWAMIWLIIWTWEPTSFKHLDLISINQPYKAFAFALPNSFFVTSGTAPLNVFPESWDATLVSGFQGYLGIFIVIFAVFFSLKTYTESGKNQEFQLLEEGDFPVEERDESKLHLRKRKSTKNATSSIFNAI